MGLNSISESRVRDNIKDYLLSLAKLGQCWFLKVLGNGMQKGGVPDYLICYKGRFVAVELKKPVDSYGLSGRQRIELNKIERAGGVIGREITSVEELKDIIKSLDELI